MDEQEEEEMDQQQLIWQYNPLAAAPDGNMEVAVEEDGFKDIPYSR